MAKFDFPSAPEINDVYTSGGTTWQWDGIAWNVVTASAPLVAQNIWTQIDADTGQTSANTTADVLTIAGGTDIATSITDDTLTINYTGTGGDGGGGVEQNLWATITGDTGSTTADSTTDNLTIAGGTDISTSVSGDTLTIAYTGSGGEGGSSTFSGTDDATAAGISVADIYEPAIAMLRVDNTGATAYTFDSHYQGDNPTIYALSGTTIAFDLTNVAGHPFEIQDGSGTAYNTGLVHVAPDGTVSTGASAQGKSSGVLYWRIRETLFGNYRYQCQSHASMVGAITLKRLSVI